MTFRFLLLAVLFVVGCSKRTEEAFIVGTPGQDGITPTITTLPIGHVPCTNGGFSITVGSNTAFACNGNNGSDGYSIVSKIEAGLGCAAGGNRIFIGLDVNRNGVYDAGDTPQNDFLICNGQDGASATVTNLAPGIECPNGGVAVAVGSNTSNICNGSDGQIGPQGPQGVAGQDGKTVSVEVIDYNGAFVTGCGYQTNTSNTPVSGKKIIFFINNDSTPNQYNSGSDTKLAEYTMCNAKDGLNGTNGDSVSVVDASVANCPNGGITLTVNSVSKHICNGLDGVDGLDGLSGPQGAPGQNGSDGKSAYEIAVENGFVGSVSDWLTSLHGADGSPGLTGPAGPIGPQGPAGTAGVGNVHPIPLCPGDQAAFPEYGLVIGDSIYAVYYGTIDGSLQGFLAKLTPGTYRTTNGTPACQFTVSNCNNGNQCINGNQVTNVNVGGLVVNMGSPSNSTHSYNVKFTITNNNSFTTGAFRIQFDIPSNVNTITCSGAVNSPTISRVGNTVKITPNGHHTFWNINPGDTSGEVTCQIERPYVNGGYGDNDLLNYSAELL
jgi:hypothetical protein